MRSAGALLVVAAAAAGPVAAQGWDMSGTLGTELRYFTESSAWPGQTTQRLQGAMSFEGRAGKPGKKCKGSTYKKSCAVVRPR